MPTIVCMGGKHSLRRDEWLIIILILVFTCCAVFLFKAMQWEAQTCKHYSYVKEVGLIDPNYFDVNGFYNKEGKYYCVFVDGLRGKDIQAMEYHEACHALVDQDYEHFCS